VQRLDALLKSLDLHDAVVVRDDWGGPIGLSWAVAHPERVSGLFILNTYAHGPRGKIKLRLPLRLFRTPCVGEVLVKGLHLFVRVFVFRVGVVHRDRLTPEVRRTVLRKNPSARTRQRCFARPMSQRTNGAGRTARRSAAAGARDASAQSP
jgi:haloalkane dehalogenase